MFVYRVHREDTHHGYWHQPLKKTVSERSFQALLKESRTNSRYKIVKVERAELPEWEDITKEVLGNEEKDTSQESHS
jgi:hypothetical protein